LDPLVYSLRTAFCCWTSCGFLFFVWCFLFGLRVLFLTCLDFLPETSQRLPPLPQTSSDLPILPLLNGHRCQLPPCLFFLFPLSLEDEALPDSSDFRRLPVPAETHLSLHSSLVPSLTMRSARFFFPLDYLRRSTCSALITHSQFVFPSPSMTIYMVIRLCPRPLAFQSPPPLFPTSPLCAR